MRYLAWLTVIAAVTVLPGCDHIAGTDAGSIRGQVTLDKQPIDSGVIAFMPLGETAGHGMAAPIEHGQYSVKLDSGRAAIGDYAVRISARRVPDQTAGSTTQPIAPKDDYIPANYNVRSKLKVSVNDPNRENVFDFNLVKDDRSSNR